MQDKVWIEIEPPKGFGEEAIKIAQERCDKVNAMLLKLGCEPFYRFAVNTGWLSDGHHKGPSWAKNAYWLMRGKNAPRLSLPDNGEWFNLDYFALEEGEQETYNG
jgi:hypothetical protein